MIALNHLTAGYPGRPVLSDVTLSFPPGEILVLAGPNGCGKSTLIRTALCLQPRLGGEILYDGVPAETLPPRKLAQRAAYLAQSRQVPNITAGRMVLHGRFPYLSYPRRYSPRDREIARQALARVDGAELAPRPMPQLSGGQRQKVYLAMVLAQDTQTVFLDEPTTYLDPRHQLEVMETARWLAGQGKAVVLVLHDLCLALRTADRLALLDRGGLVYLDTPEAVFSSGTLAQVFGVRLGRIDTPEGPRYFYQ
ncbi:MAG: ABC transporter ATP-binding protein [Lawsonibacter sp.]|nr:ABC transporter ATP-binding protein [Lawsonibacter sp.]